MSELEERKLASANWFRQLRDKICERFEKIDSSGSFTRKTWKRTGGGGGETALLRSKIFEKVGVNISTVYGEFTPEFRQTIPGAEKDPRFWASGISVVAHMASPLIPAAHMNTRFICTTKQWFGGAADLTPIYSNDKDSADFHAALKSVCDVFDKEYYPKFKKNCDEYFYLKHRKEMRGIGGIFYDYLNSGNWDKDFSFTKDVGQNFLEIYSEIINRHKDEKWTPEQREFQLKKRGRYVEFNLLYDRGTKFGLATEGNTEAILMSLPPLVKWD